MESESVWFKKPPIDRLAAGPGGMHTTMSLTEESPIHVNFGSGAELLFSYWGYLTGGGLIIADPGLEVGQPIAMRVTIRSSSSNYSLRGTVVKREPDSSRAVIAFRPGEAHDMLLSEALADSDNVAPRRYARFQVEAAIKLIVGNDAHAGTLLNISREGCCLVLPKSTREPFAVDTEVVVVHGEVHAIGTVVWCRNLERGVRLRGDEALPLIQLLCPDVC